jgi:hypothetical protein
MEMANEITDVVDSFLELDRRDTAARVSDALLPHIQRWIREAMAERAAWIRSEADRAYVPDYRSGLMLAAGLLEGSVTL